nr:photosystem II protein M [Paragymnopteris bipinnata var. bipinnata]UAT96840.1 photosystem II protein M [Paragymnopteris bipinnata var. bipinnata]
MNYRYGSKHSCVCSHRTFYLNSNSFSTYPLHSNSRSE